jgi:hypothetical protein
LAAIRDRMSMARDPCGDGGDAAGKPRAALHGLD